MFQVWIIANKVPGSHSLSRGTVCHRTGVQPRQPKGQGWDYGIGVSKAYAGGLPGPRAAWSPWVGGRPQQSPSGSLISCSLEAWSLSLTPAAVGDEALSFQGGWDHITVRANATRALRSRSQETATGRSGEPGLPSTPSRAAGAPHEARGPVCC